MEMQSHDSTSSEASIARSNELKYLPMVLKRDVNAFNSGSGGNDTESSVANGYQQHTEPVYTDWQKKLNFPFGPVPFDPKDPTPPFLKKVGFQHKSLRKEPEPVQVVYTAEKPRRSPRFAPTPRWLSHLESRSNNKKVKRHSLKPLKTKVVSTRVAAEKHYQLPSFKLPAKMVPSCQNLKKLSTPMNNLVVQTPPRMSNAGKAAVRPRQSSRIPKPSAAHLRNLEYEFSQEAKERKTLKSFPKGTDAKRCNV